MAEFYWHIHHDKLLEPANEPIENRIAYIKGFKPADEQETRLRLLKRVAGELPKAVLAAWAAYNEARAAFDKAWVAFVRAGAAYSRAWAAYDKAGAAYNEALQDSRVETEALHAQECPDCSWNGRTIFPDKEARDDG